MAPADFSALAIKVPSSTNDSFRAQSSKQVARHLGVTEQTLKKYIKSEGAPRAIVLALFWETRWGRSAADTDAANFGAIYYRKAMGLERENLAMPNSPFFNVG